MKTLERSGGGTKDGLELFMNKLIKGNNCRMNVVRGNRAKCKIESWHTNTDTEKKKLLLGVLKMTDSIE
jgi:hypothetical protein